MNEKSYILYLEDDPIDALRFSSTLKKLNLEQDVVVKKNGEEGLQWLEDNRSYLPSIILLDLNMPRMNGIEFLEIISDDHDLNKIPVIVFTTSSNKSDVDSTSAYKVAGYMVKPFDHSDYNSVIQIITDYWGNSKLSHL